MSDDSSGGGTLARVGGKRSAQLERRAWRAEERKRHPKPLSGKVVHPRVLVDVVPAPKKGRAAK